MGSQKRGGGMGDLAWYVKGPNMEYGGKFTAGGGPRAGERM
jgi:hypothetical protein